eukprot:TRINITY_DN26569_c0_g1_i1.p1 TRINITY_DN26569_c0_g1~~TRINITY_DN26569_c0_g1_i1.p1  ORF type:complete len:286 (+),score=37.12 TRINITY_DN26569_c0_g1_i1:494-1351(+)
MAPKLRSRSNGRAAANAASPPVVANEDNPNQNRRPQSAPQPNRASRVGVPGPGSVENPSPSTHESPSKRLKVATLLSPSPILAAPRPRVLLAASGSVAAIKFSLLAQSVSQWADVKAVCTRSSLHFIERNALPLGVSMHADEEEWSSWKKIGDSVLHIELRKWADILLIAPLSANTLAKMAGGLCDNLLTCIIRAWDFSKPLLVAPAMNTMMWDSPFTVRHLEAIERLGVFVIPPISKRLACGDVGTGAMAEPATIEAEVRKKWMEERARTGANGAREVPAILPS